MTQTNTLLVEREQNVCVITLNRPETMNSFDREMKEQFRTALADARDDKETHCLLLTGGGRGFCTGQDLKERGTNPIEGAPDLAASLERDYIPFIRTIVAMDKPVVCAVNGVAAGVGASIALACDIVIAGRSASFVQAFIKIGLVPDSGGTWHLPRVIGLARAKGLALLGDRLPAEQAAEWGMIWRCVDDDQLMPEARTIAGQLAALPARGLAASKRLLNESFMVSLNEELEREKEAMRALGKTHDYSEGVRAFLEKRKPVFRGE